MSLFLKQDDQRSELQKKLAAELQARALDRPKMSERPDGVEDSQYIEDMKKTTSLAWVWVLITIVFVGILIWLTVLSMSR